MLLDKARLVRRSCDFVVGQPPQLDETRIVDDALELADGLQETRYGFLVADLFRYKVTPAQRIEIALLAAALFGGLGQKEVTGVVQIRPLVEVALKGSGQKAEVVFLNVGFVLFFDESVLLVDDRVVGQHFGRLESCRVHGLVFC